LSVLDKSVRSREPKFVSFGVTAEPAQTHSDADAHLVGA
jgi:hypothetical protein